MKCKKCIKSCIHHCTPIYMYGQIFIRSYFKAKDTTTDITDILPLQLESVPKVHNILSGCFTAGHLSCCLVLSTGRTLLLLQTEWCHSPAPTKTIKTVSIEFKFTRWHKVNSIREKCTWFNFLNSTTWVKMYSKICFASLESWGKFDVTPRMSPHSLT